ncbi:MAG: hypothetical protein L0Y56_14755, partial [Nitrospira sp.]|nr:hypothetical protein [Nitrospira sp.]
MEAIFSCTALLFSPTTVVLGAVLQALYNASHVILVQRGVWVVRLILRSRDASRMVPRHNDMGVGVRVRYQCLKPSPERSKVSVLLTAGQHVVPRLNETP